MSVGRRHLLTGASALAIAALYPMSAQATPTTVTYSVAYTGADFASYITATAAASIGSNFTVSSSAKTLQAGSSSTVIHLAASEGATDFLGHPLTIGGVTCLITAYNTSTQVATVSARAGYPASFGSSPSAGTAYTIADVAVVVNIGQSAAGSNLWTDSSGNWTISGITRDSTHTLTINGATAWTSNVNKYPLRRNLNGDTNQPVLIYSTNAGGTGYLILDSTVANGTVINDLQFYVSSFGQGSVVQNPSAAAGTSVVTFNRCWLQAINPTASGIINAMGAFNNCVIATDNAPNYIAVGYGSVYNNCLIYGYAISSTASSAAYATGFGAILNECFIVGCAALVNPGSFSGYSGATFTRCYSDLAGTGVTQVTAANQIAALSGQTSAALDLRPKSTGGLPGNGGAPSTVTDLYGVTRSVSASTVGPVENAVAVPALQAVSWDVNYAGAITDVAPNGTVSAYSWSGGTATVTLGTHGLTVGGVYQIAICNASNSSGYFGLFNATALNSTQVTYAVASSPTPPANPAQWVCYLFNTLLGVCGGAADLTYFQSGLTCSGTAADSSHIVLDASTAASVIGHPVQYQSGNICIIGNYDPVTHIATVIPPPTGSGFFANFGTTPQSGQAFTIFPMSVEFAIGQSAAGNTLWNKTILGGLAGGFGNSGAINFGPVTTSPASFVKLRGTTAYNKTVALGTPANNGSAIVIKNNSDHTAVIGVGCDNLVISQIQIYCSGNNQEDGCLLALSGAGSVAMTNVVLRGDSGTDDQAHTPWFGQSGFNFSTVAATNCAFVATDKRNLTGGTAGGGFTAKFCMLASTCNVSTTVSTTVASGTTIVVASNAGITAGDVSHAGSYLIHPNISDGANVLSISGSGPYTLTVQGGSITGSISAGAAIQLDNMEWANLQTVGSPTMTSASTAFLGMGRPVKATPAVATYATCATDSISATGISGLTNSISYAAAVTAGSGLFATGTVDCRLPVASPLIAAGTYDAAVPLDIFGQTRPNPPAIGPAEPVAASGTNHNGLLLMGVG